MIRSSGIEQPARQAGRSARCSWPPWAKKGCVPAIIRFQMLKNSAVEPLSRATKPAPCRDGSGWALLTRKDEFSSRLRP